MGHLDTPATELNCRVFTFVEIEGHTIQEAMVEFGIAKRTVYQHINQYRDRTPLPDSYLATLRDRYLRVGDKALTKLEEYVDTEKPEPETMRKVVKDAGIGVERQEIDTKLIVHDSVSPEERFKAIRDEWAKRNLDIGPKQADINTTPQVIANIETESGQSKTPLDFDIAKTLESADITPTQIAQVKTDTGEQK